MLRLRSILVQATLLILAGLVNSQRYSSEYEVLDGDVDGHRSSYTEDSERPDYTRYFNTDASAPLITANVESNAAGSGFANPAEFSSFFNSPEFGFGSHSTKQEILKPANPLVQAAKPTARGFVAANDFTSGFSNYNSDPFTKDFFEQSAQKQRQETDEYSETKPGPNYVSHRVPYSKNLDREPLKTHATEVHHRNGEAEPYNNYSHENIEEDDEEKDNIEEDEEKEEVNEENEAADDEDKSQYKKPNLYEYDVKHLKQQSVPQFEGQKGSLQNADRSSYNALPNPLLPGYYTKYTQLPAAALSPYQKYSFQPVSGQFGLKSGYLEALQSTVAPFNPAYAKLANLPTANIPKYEPQPSENIQRSAKNCRKINKEVTEKDIKEGRFRRQAMDCYVCEDPKNGANYEQCSYSTDPNEKSYFIGKAEKYTKPVAPRYKRYTNKQQKENEEEEKQDYVDPYERIKAQSQKYYSIPEEFSKYHYNPKNFELTEEYRFPQEYFEGDKEKSESEIVSEKLVKDGENCKKVNKDSMTCMICTNPKNGGNYEQCSYTSAPAEKKYAYVRERKFDGNENPIEDKVVESSEPKEEIIKEERPASRRHHKSRSTSAEKLHDNYSSEIEENPNRRSDNVRQSPRSARFDSKRRLHSHESEPEDKKRRQVEQSSYEIPDHFAETTARREKTGVRGLDPELYGSADSSEVKVKRKEPFEKEIEDYHFKFFPKYNQESETKNEEKKVKPTGKFQEETKKDVEAVLAEFAKKDRSNCKKATKKGMTCFLCTDKTGIKNEECMFVSESQPQSSHIAYHEARKVKDTENEKQQEDEGEGAESKQKAVTKELKEEYSKKKRFFKKATTESPLDVAVAPSKESSAKLRSTTPTTPVGGVVRVPRKLNRSQNISIKDSALEESRKTEVKREIKEEPTIKTPVEFKVEGEEGAYSLETKPVYSKVFGLTLPRYMLEISEHEKDFDEASGH